MSDLMLLAVLRMPPELWTGEAIDVIQRHARYIDAADRIEAQQSKIATLTEQVKALEEGAKYCIDIYMNLHVSEVSKQTKCVQDAWECGQKLYARKVTNTPITPKEAE